METAGDAGDNYGGRNIVVSLMQVYSLQELARCTEDLLARADQRCNIMQVHPSSCMRDIYILSNMLPSCHLLFVLCHTLQRPLNAVEYLAMT